VSIGMVIQEVLVQYELFEVFGRELLIPFGGNNDVVPSLKSGKQLVFRGSCEEEYGRESVQRVPTGNLMIIKHDMELRRQMGSCLEE
jgi:hypothetical protein